MVEATVSFSMVMEIEGLSYLCFVKFIKDALGIFRSEVGHNDRPTWGLS